jgi:hypothetical protein
MAADSVGISTLKLKQGRDVMLGRDHDADTMLFHTVQSTVG